MSETPASFSASIAKVCASKGHRTVVMLNSSLYQALPLAFVTVTLRKGELFMATGSNGQVRYTEDLEEAWWFAHYNGSDGVPDAIQILSPCTADKGISTLNTLSVYERAVAA
ncbi:hypothetical protein [Paenarthrobacter sp. YJN-5]|uniref:hypothetical protein n=1 Tax=Paenarthrobacter sp. YJN-5 TaxID=2735316 RepID=UPI001878FDB7|nr:hypothetical protein [Paenarthrobacter sp. YJN-5]QOT19583.1 hypothetical protein HMI59_23460 [Paenarthrobacter sp. YJN-5]